jgi:hypothetical protein
MKTSRISTKSIPNSHEDKTVSCTINPSTPDVILSIKRKLAKGEVKVMINKKLHLAERVGIQVKVMEAWFKFTEELRYIGIIE